MKRLRVGIAMGLLIVGTAIPTAGRPSGAATPQAGTISPSDPVVTWTGPTTTSVDGPGVCQTSTCDRFDLTVAVPGGYWSTFSGGVLVEIGWESPKDVFEVIITNEQGSTVAQATIGPNTLGATAHRLAVPDADGRYRVEVIYTLVTEAAYSGTASFVSSEGRVEKGAGAFFDPTPLRFGPSTIVSPQFLGAEPQMVVERGAGSGAPAELDPNRIFIDWPLSFYAQIGQLSRSTDGGDSFHLLYDRTCAQRNRPTCQTGGGGDSASEVSPYTGTLYFADQQALIAQEAVASSPDHGDSFPLERQFAITNETSTTDREWLAPSDPSLVSVGPRRIDAFLSYLVGLTQIYVQGIDEHGLPISQPVPQITHDVSTLPGPLRFDTSEGPGRGWLYQPYARGVSVSTAYAPDYRDPQAWRESRITSDVPEIFPWLSLDAQGNAYAVWVNEGVVYYSFSAIDDPANDPRDGGRPGTSWAPQLRVTPLTTTSAIFGAVTAGDRGRIAIAYVGTDDHEGRSNVAGPSTEWRTYGAVVTNALAEGGPPIVQTGSASHRVVHVGNIDGTDDSLLDFIDIDHDSAGRTAIAFTDNYSSFGSRDDPGSIPTQARGQVRPFVYFTKQISGQSLSARRSPVKVRIPTNDRPDPRGDATWPPTSTGKHLPSLDLLGISIALQGEDLVARIPLGEADLAAMTGDLAAYNDVSTTQLPAERLQYLVRFSSATEIYHLSAEVLDGELRGFGGRLDANDDIREPRDTVVMASYRKDTGYPVAASLEDGALILRAPASAFGLTKGAELLGLSAFSMAGPAQPDEDLADPMRLIDATAPLDAIARPRRA